MATVVYRDQLLEKDEQGMTPLLLAAQAPIYKFQDIADDGSELDELLEDHLYGDDDHDKDDQEDTTNRLVLTFICARNFMAMTRRSSKLSLVFGALTVAAAVCLQVHVRWFCSDCSRRVLNSRDSLFLFLVVSFQGG